MPAIIGSVGVVRSNGNSPTQTGCLFWEKEGTQNVGDYANQPRIENLIKIDASKSSSIYGKSATVQPPALRLIPQIKF